MKGFQSHPLFLFHHKQPFPPQWHSFLNTVKLRPHPCHATLISYFTIEYSLFPLKLFILPSQTNLKITSIFLLIHFNSLYERIPFTSIVFFSSQTAFSPSMTFHYYFLFHYWIQSDSAQTFHFTLIQTSLMIKNPIYLFMYFNAFYELISFHPIELQP